MQRLLRVLGYTCATICLLGLLLSGPLFRLEVVGFGTIFQALKIVVPIGLAGLLLLVIARATGAVGNRGLGVAALLLIALYLPVTSALTAKKLPFIHDITTDTTNTPAFSQTLREARIDARNPPEYPGAEVAELQREAYPDIQPVMLDTDMSATMERIKAIVETMGWEIVTAQDDRLEATDTTFWFGFKDDVVIRLQPAGTNTRVDIRSKSRIGASDVGANADRIRRFFAALNDQTT